jgi:hypothetical protein
MMISPSRALAFAVVVGAGIGWLPMQAAAQSPGFAPNAIGGKQSTAAPPPVAPPPALPGAASNQGQAAPPTRLPSDMEPTEALFDAINRGDIAAAREAINRGADLSGRNVLGMSPMELSVDLGRKDIMFLLLSMRAGDTPRGRVATAQPAKQSGQPVRQAARQPGKATASAPVAQPIPPPSPRLFANDGGTPIPNAGFLGFDASRH